MNEVLPCALCGEIPADELYKIIPVMNNTQLAIVGGVLGSIVGVVIILAIRFTIRYIRDMRAINQKE